MRAIIPSIIALGIGLPSIGFTRTFSYDVPLETQFQELTVEPSGSFELGQGFSLTTGLVFDSTVANTITADTIVVQHEGERVSLWGGKIAPNFGQGWDQEFVPISNHATEYELSGMLGIGGSFSVGEIAGSTLQVSANVFQYSNHTSYVLSTEVLTKAGISITGSTINSPDRQGQLLGLRAQLLVKDNLVEPLFEIAHFGEEKIASTGIGLKTEQAYLTIQHSMRILSNQTDSVVQASIRWTP